MVEFASPARGLASRRKLGPTVIRSIASKLAPTVIRSIASKLAPTVIRSIASKLAPTVIRSIASKLAPTVIRSIASKLAPTGSLLLACFAAMAFSSLSASAQTACRVLDPELAGVYQGGCKDGLAEGYGEAKGRAEYRGDFHAGRKHGKGVKTWPSGDRYEGEFVEDRKEGTGKYTWGARGPSAGESYSGGYLNDQRQGYGAYEWPSGDRYAGPWVRDEVTGPPTPMMIARARAKTETLAAVGKPGAKVCRALRVGIAVRDWIRGVVTAVDADRIAVRIDDPGRQPHEFENKPLVKGMTIWSPATEWTPCL